MIVKDARSFARVRWAQRGFRRSAAARPPGHTQRNLMGQLDGTVNPTGTRLDRAVWVDRGPDWLRGGTTLVLRRIRDGAGDLGRRRPGGQGVHRRAGGWTPAPR